MSGEGFGQEFDAHALQTFLQIDDALLVENLEQMVSVGLVGRTCENKYALTAFGTEGRRALPALPAIVFPRQRYRVRVNFYPHEPAALTPIFAAKSWVSRSPDRLNSSSVFAGVILPSCSITNSS